ncbi:MAG: DsrE family protein [Clostridia bacterium]|jgi:hypothetical protein|nr:DsrE family protein [Clostridia bacterium]NLV33876.1 DsrE family protein [Clostridiaceae bacterium]MDD3092740.1 DsrE family protein [Clostridia bacterium]MDD3970340.1 DsrE family protein [Clostridia bacterium]MDD4503070.1 DsrE family protein [Clostridia bacterium]
MKKTVFFAFRGNEMCFIHILLNALEMKQKGKEVKIVFEGEAVRLPKVLSDKANPMYRKCLEEGIIDGVCEACSKTLGAYEDNKALGLTFLSELKGHPSINRYMEEGFEVILM